MKKIMLLLLLILPVVIVILSFAIAGYVGREIMYVQVESVTIDKNAFLNPADGGYREEISGRFILTAEVGRQYELGKYFTVVPAKIKFTDLKFGSTNEAAAKVGGDGKIHITGNMRASDRTARGGVEITIGEGTDTFYTVCVEIKADGSRFDYLGVDYNMLRNGVSGGDWKSFCAVENDCLVISAGDIPGGNIISDFGRLLRNGFDTAPFNLLMDSPHRAAFLNSLEIKSGNPSALVITAEGQSSGINQFNARVLGAAEEFTLTVKAALHGNTAEVNVNIRIK